MGDNMKKNIFRMPNTFHDRDYTWLVFQSKILNSVSGYGRGKIDTSLDDFQWWFLAPNEISDGSVHSWGETENVGTKLAQKIHKISKGVTEIKNIGSSFENLSKSVIAKKSIGVNNVIEMSKNIKLDKSKFDSSLSYKGSNRRRYTFSFNFSLFPGTKNKTIKEHIVTPIKKLQELSCAEMIGDFDKINYPRVFNIYSTPGNLINIPYAALESVQPIWKGPFKKGMPSFVEVQIAVIDLQPLYSNSIKNENIVKVKSMKDLNTLDDLKSKFNETKNKVNKVVMKVRDLEKNVSKIKSKVNKISHKPTIYKRVVKRNIAPYK